MTINAAVVGATGYAGAELVRILSGHPDVTLSVLTSRQYAGERFDRIYPALNGVVSRVCDIMDMERIDQSVDVVFTALPHKLPMVHVPELLRRGKKVVDLSADFRFRNPRTYEQHYQPHTEHELLKEAVYGLTEIYGNDIQKARLIGNPGCYPTSILLPLIPLVRNRMIRPDGLIADSKSGVSGAGRSPSLTTLFCEVHESFKAYKVAEHRHNPEIDEILSAESGRDVHITFTPHLVPMSRGMLTTLYAVVAPNVSLADIRDCLVDTYKNRPFVRILEAGRIPDTRFVRGTNYCDIGVHLDAAADRLILISAIDNLVKGAAGQAVQNMNVMFGLDESSGLSNVPYPL